jgi:hypothetical protein
VEIDQWLTIEALIWLFPVAFILHDFEEIIMVEKWVATHSDLIRSKLPNRLAGRVIKQFSMSTAQFAVSVFVIFLFVSSSTYLAYQYINQGPLGNIHFFMVCTLVFFLHLFTHLAQSLYFRTITPGSITSLLIVLPYSLLLFHALSVHHVITWSVVFRSLPYAILIIPLVLFAHWIRKKAAGVQSK